MQKIELFDNTTKVYKEENMEHAENVTNSSIEIVAQCSSKSISSTQYQSSVCQCTTPKTLYKGIISGQVSNSTVYWCE